MMHWWWWDGGAPVPWFGMILGPIMMIAVFVIVMLIVAYLLRALGLRPYMSAPESWRSIPSRSALHVGRSIASSMRMANASCRPRRTFTARTIYPLIGGWRNGLGRRTRHGGSLMSEFATRTGLSPAAPDQQRYLWTDAFAICNFLDCSSDSRL